MNQQLTLLGREEEAAQLKRVALRALLGVVDRAGTKVVAGELGMSENNLRLALRERERHGLDLDDFWVAVTFDPAAVIDALAQHTGHKPLERQPQVTDSEMLARLVLRLGKLGSVGQAILEDTLLDTPGVKP